MIKVYFAPNWGLSAADMVADYKQQTPEGLGIWNDIQYTINPSEADYLIIQDECSISLLEEFDINKRLYFSREALTPGAIESHTVD